MHSYKFANSVGMKPRFLFVRGRDASGSMQAAPLVAGLSPGLTGVSGYTEKDAPTAKRQKTVATTFQRVKCEGEVQSTLYKDKEKAEVLEDPRARRAAVVAAVRCTLTLKAVLLRGENLADRNAELEHRLEEMQAHQKELVQEAVHHELAEHVANVTGGLEERVKILTEEKLPVEGDFEGTHGRIKVLALRNRRVATLSPPLLILRQTQDLPELSHLGFFARQGPVPLENKMDITPEEAQLAEDKAASVAAVQPEV
ncbi:hypothetical protein GIB67_007122 [Kingdonia uniflora]|uniref:Uncharacterized protein n=1 Tax=Kingdonia uniflora TaxID=39325 RepID=A0A7J7ML85_9MAGN|nr:hypothetical protein GIB67_007122 [Kingdonia uniflora]